MTHKTQHTPGPWHRNIPPASKYATIFAGRNTHVAVVQSRGLSEDEIEGNANLIHAAPDLLAALKRAQHYMRNCGADMERDYPEIDAAIAKAERARPT